MTITCVSYLSEHMPRHSYFASGTFDPEALRILRAAFDEAVLVLQARITDDNRQRVYDAIAMSIMDFAKLGERDPYRLRLHGIAGGGAAL